MKYKVSVQTVIYKFVNKEELCRQYNEYRSTQNTQYKVVVAYVQRYKRNKNTIDQVTEELGFLYYPPVSANIYIYTSAVSTLLPIDITSTALPPLDNANNAHASSTEAISSNNNIEEARSSCAADDEEEYQ